MSLDSTSSGTTLLPHFQWEGYICSMKISYLSNSSYVGCVVIIGSHMIDQDWDGQVGIISHILLSLAISENNLPDGLPLGHRPLLQRHLVGCQEGLHHAEDQLPGVLRHWAPALRCRPCQCYWGLVFSRWRLCFVKPPKCSRTVIDWNVHFGDTNNLWTYHGMVNQDTWRGSKLIKFNFSAQIPKKRQHWKLVYKKPLYM